MEYIHKPAYIAATVTTCVVFVITMVMNGLAGTGDGVIFPNSTGAISAEFDTSITPAGWAFSIWGLIYAWQAAWLIYGISTIFRKTSYGYLYIAPGHMHPSLYLFFTFNLITNITWLILWANSLPQVSLFVIILQLFSTCICLGISYKRLFARGGVLKREGNVYEIWFVRILVQNGLALYAAWLTVATLLNLNTVMIYYGGISDNVSGTICLSFLLLAVTSWFFIDNFVCDKYVRYTTTPYFVIILAVVAIMVRNWSVVYSSSALAVFILVATCLAAIVKIILLLVRHIKRPQFVESFFASTAFYGSTSSGYEKDKVLFASDREFN